MRAFGQADRRKGVPPAPEGRPSPRVPTGHSEGREVRIIGVLSYKGGTGKTTTVVHLAAGLARRGARVLCIDLDAQGGLATWLNVRCTYPLTHLLLGRAEPLDCIIHARENLDLIASDRTLLQAEGAMWRSGGKARMRLAEALAGLTGYDYILLDYSPSISFVGECGLHYNREVIIPVAMNYMALVATRQVIETLKGIGESPDHRVRLFLIVPTFYDARNRLDCEVADLLERRFPGRVADPIRISVKFSEAASHGMTIYEYAPNSPGAADYERLVERVFSSG